MKKKNKLYTVNEWNKPLFAQGVDRVNNNIFDGLNGSMLSSPGFTWNDGITKFGDYTQNGIPTGSLTDYLKQQGALNKINGIPQVTTPNASSIKIPKVGTAAAGSSGTKFNWGKAGMGAAQAAAIAGNIPTKEGNLFNTMDPLHHLAGGRESAVGNGLHSAGQGLFQAGAQSGNGWLMLAGGIAQGVGSLWNGAFGAAWNDENISDIENNIEGMRNSGNELAKVRTNADYLSTVLGTDIGYDFNNSYVGKNGWFNHKATRKANKLRKMQDQAREVFKNYMVVGAKNADNTMDEIAYANAKAYGGLLDRANQFAKGGKIEIKHPGRLTALKKRTGKTEAELWAEGKPEVRKMITFARNARKWKKAYGGLLGNSTGSLGLMQQDALLSALQDNSFLKKNALNNLFDAGGFMKQFAEDPLAAALQYRNQLDQMAAEKAASEAAAIQQAEYASMQKQLDDLALQNQGLQAQIAAMPTNIPASIAGLTPDEVIAANIANMTVPAEPASLPSTSQAASKKKSKNPTWNYVEDQLRKSGKFNDVQIDGIRMNIQRESGFNDQVWGDNSTAFGLGQWHGARQPKDKSLEGQTKYLIDTITNYDGTMHWLNKDDYNGFMRARTPEEAHYYLAKGYERPKKKIVEKIRKESEDSLRKHNLKAFGGELGTNGTDFTNGLLYVDAGGTHEENPLDGVPVGVDAEGAPNLVEEGETIYNDYVFSNRMKVPAFMKKELGLGSNNDKKEITFAEASKKLAKESEQRPNDPISQDGLEAALNKLAHVQESERAVQQAKEEQEEQENMYRTGGPVKKGKKQTTNKSSNHPYDLPEEEEQVQQPITSVAPASPAPTVSTPVVVAPTTVAAPTASTTPGFNYNLNKPWSLESAVAPQVYQPNLTPEPFSIKKDSEGLGSWANEDNSQYNKPDLYPTWMRYVPAFGAGIMSFTDALGITNKPDYSYANKIEAAANRAGYMPHISAPYIGNYRKYQPLDLMYAANRAGAASRATDRSILNHATPVGTRMSGLLANGYNSQLANGELFNKALMYNDALDEKVAEYNRKTNMFNAQMDLEAAIANARYAQQARQYQLSGLAQAAAMRDAIDQRIGAARSANLTNLLTSLGNIGRENFAMNQINTDRSRHYYGDLKGDVSGYKGGKKAACGGKMNKRK